MVDVSAQGTEVSITFGDKKMVGGKVVWGNLKHLPVKKTDFADQENPISPGRVPASQLEVDLNGNGIVSRQVTPIRLTLSLIPNSWTDLVMRAHVYVAREGTTMKSPVRTAFGGAGSEYHALVERMTISYPNGTVAVFLDGTVSVGTMSPGVSQDGRLVGSSYEFTFAKADMPQEKP